MSEAEPDPPFQVRDRRRRPEAEASVEGRQEARQGRPDARGERAEVPPEPPRSREGSLVGLFMMIASLAIAALEGVEDPATGQRHQDPGQAVDLIDTLMLLRDKTDGHRTPEESQALEQLIYDLQLRYVRAVGRPA
jgi:hypothetical protein